LGLEVARPSLGEEKRHGKGQGGKKGCPKGIPKKGIIWGEKGYEETYKTKWGNSKIT